MDVLEEASAIKKFLQSIGFADDSHESDHELKEKAQDICQFVLKEFDLKYRKQDRKLTNGHSYNYHFKWQDKKFVMIAALHLESRHLTVSIWNESNTKFYKVLGSSELKNYYPLRAHMMDQMEQFLSGEHE